MNYCGIFFISLEGSEGKRKIFSNIQSQGKVCNTDDCEFFGVSRSGYYGFVKRMDKPEKHLEAVKEISECQQATRQTYGYRRVAIYLENKGIKLNPKTILRLMNKYNLLSCIRRNRKYRVMSQQLHRYPNLLNRDFSTTRPNEKWATDISYIKTKQGVLYLSMIRDLYDNSIVAYKTGTEQTVNLVLRTVKAALKKGKGHRAAATAQ